MLRYYLVLGKYDEAVGTMNKINGLVRVFMYMPSLQVI